jgi:beta-N-acetylhexosaminidase
MIFFNLFRLTAFSLSVFISFFYTNSIKEMSLEEKVGQLLMVHFHGEDINEEARTLVQELNVGGFIYYNWSNGLHSPQQIRNLSLHLQELAQENRFHIPLLIAVDQEGGIVNRLTQGFTIFPGNKALAMTGDPHLGEQSAFAMGQELRSVGINLNLSPVVDVNNNYRSPAIGIRSFGHSVDQVIAYAKKAMSGYSRAGIITSLKHYPGHGDVDLDSHKDLPVLNKTFEQLEKMELLPFEVLANQADIIMTAHLMVPAFDAENCSTLSPDTLNYLRRDIGFENVIMTDSLVMEGLLKNCRSIDDAAIRAINAGCDILLLGGKKMNGSEASLELTVEDVRRIHTSIVQAVRSGVIPEKRLNESLQRVLDLKKRYSLPIAMAMEEKEPEEEGIRNLDQHQSLAQKTAFLSLRIIKNKPIPSLKDSKLALFAPAIAKGSIEETSLPHLGEELYSLYFNDVNPTEQEVRTAFDMAQKSDVLIFCTYDAWKNNGQAALIESLMNHHKPMVLISLGNPFDSTLYPEADLIVITFSPTVHSIQAASDAINE